MEFLKSLFEVPLLTGTIFVITGLVMMKYPAKKINILYGYRTPSAMATQERWDFAQRYSAKELTKWGMFTTLSSLLGLVSNLSETIETFIGFSIIFLCVILVYIRSENAINDKFGKL